MSCTEEITTEVETLQEDIYCANKARTEKIYAWLWLAEATTNGQIIQTYVDKLSDQWAVVQIFDAIDADRSLRDNDKAFLKVIMIVRTLLAQHASQQPTQAPKIPCGIDISSLTCSTDLQKDICSLAFWKSLREFQQATWSKNDCLIWRRTLRALGAYVPQREMYKQKTSPLEQHFSAPGFQEYVQQRSNETGRQAHLCSWYTNGMLTELLHVQKKTYKFPEQESSAWEKDTDLRAPWFARTSVAWLDEQQIKDKLTTCPVGTTLTVQNSASSRQEHGVTHTLIHLWGGTRSEQVWAKTHTLSNIASLVYTDPSTWDLALQRNHWQRYRFIASGVWKTGSTLYEPNLDQMTTVAFRTLNEQEFGAIKKRHNSDGVQIAKYLAKTYGWSYMYYLSVFGTHVADNATVQVPLPKWTDREKKKHLSSADILIYQNNLALEKSPFKDSEEVLNSVWITWPTDAYRGMLGGIYDNEWNGWRKRKAAEWYLSSKMYRNGGWNITRWFNPINSFISLWLVHKWHGDIATWKKDITSFWPFQIRMDVYKNLVSDPRIQKNLHAILEKEWFNKWYRALRWDRRQWDNLASLSYEDIREVLYNDTAALYLAHELCKQNITTIHAFANNAGITVRQPDVFLTGQLMYNVGASATYGAILQQELYKIAKEHNCSPPENFVFDGSDGPQTQALLTCIRDLIGDDVVVEKTATGRISHLVASGKRISVQDIWWLAEFFSWRTYKHNYYPALDFGFLQNISQYSWKKVRAHYVRNTVDNARLEKRDRTYTGTIDRGSNRCVDRLRKLTTSSVVNYRRDDIDHFSNDFHPSTGSWDLDCVDLVKLYHADRTDNWRNTVDPKIKDYTDFTGMFADQFRIHWFITPETYGDQNRYKDMLYNIRVGDVVGIWHEWKGGKQIKWIDKPMSLSHGGVVSRIEKNSAGEVVNVWMLHSSWSADLWWIWPTEVKLFGPWGYYESVCDYQNPLSTKNAIVFWGLLGRNIMARNQKNISSVT